jgi:hypothetical protein
MQPAYRDRERARARTDLHRTSILLPAYLWALARLSRGDGPVPRMPWPGAKGLVRSRDLRLEGVATGSSEVNCTDPRVDYGRRQHAGQDDDACTGDTASGQRTGQDSAQDDGHADAGVEAGRGHRAVAFGRHHHWLERTLFVPVRALAAAAGRSERQCAAHLALQLSRRR